MWRWEERLQVVKGKFNTVRKSGWISAILAAIARLHLDLQRSSQAPRHSYFSLVPAIQCLLYDVLSSETFALFSFLSAITLIAFTYDFCRLFPHRKPLGRFLSQSAVRQASDLAFWSNGLMTSLWLEGQLVSKETKRKDFDFRTDAAFKRNLWGCTDGQEN